MDGVIWDALWVSMRAAVLAIAIVTVLGVALAYLLATREFIGRRFLEAVCSLPLVLPPTVVGFYLVWHFGQDGPIKDVTVAVFGKPIVFTFTAVVIAQAIGAFPFCLRAARAAIADVDPELVRASRVMGLSPWRVAWQVRLPLARRGIVSGIAMAFAVALGDYGATVAVASGRADTQTMPLALVSAGNTDLARDIALVQIAVAVALMLGISRLGRPRW